MIDITTETLVFLIKQQTTVIMNWPINSDT